MIEKISIFINKYVKELKEHNAAVFLGAGFSKGSGFVDWKSLLKGIADELGLDIEKEFNLISLAQYYCNKNRSRYEIDRLIFEEFTKDVDISENHRILSRLPIFTYWTTNYDSLIEDALKEAKKIPDVKYNAKQLSQTKPRRDAIVYKMHGDKEHPSDTVIIKEDYELYYRKYAPFITALNGDLISKTFLFIGFSFTDPNLDYILSRIKVEYESQNQRTHYAIIKEINCKNYELQADYEYDARKQALFIEDLKRYNIQALLIDDYNEITKILTTIEKCFNQKNIFISGSAKSYGNWNKDEATSFIHNLSKVLIQNDYNIISGFGLGVGSFVITGALEEIYMKNRNINNDRLLLRPFPQGIVNENNRIQLWTKYRKDMLSRAGVSIFVFGNKIDKESNIIKANGVMSEFEIAKEYGNLIVPVGCTGFAAKDIWNEIKDNFDAYYQNSSSLLKELFEKLNASNDNKTELVNTIIEFINEAKKCILNH
ncbi:SIR2 family protein [Clostridium botulinum]|uniref:SIR2 family protein n=1 Tax=Clostridium botulinum TaxID=1491 RepID=UPI001E4BFDCD|nr:SIR2 family protein [Clostridium botulinum]MCC5439658.1 SIR2 family protein [Clostridium botulinum]NFR56442.1 hypothetical protein [Clostridium botulinum]